MEAIVLAGGLGTRLREAVPDVPKPMAPIRGRPFLELLLSSLSSKGFSRVVISVGYKAEVISSHFGRRYQGLDIAYAIEQTPLGTGGAVRLAIDQCLEDHIFVFNGDTFLDLEVHAVNKLWKHNHKTIIVGRSVSDTTRYGRLIIENERVMGFTEKGVSGAGIINAGCYVFQRQLFNHIPIGNAFSLESHFLIPLVSSAGADLFITTGQFIDIGVPEDFQLAQTIL